MMDLGLKQLSNELKLAYKEFDEVTAMDLIDSAIYKISCLESKINHYIKTKKLELH